MSSVRLVLVASEFRRAWGVCLLWVSVFFDRARHDTLVGNKDERKN